MHIKIFLVVVRKPANGLKLVVVYLGLRPPFCARCGVPVVLKQLGCPDFGESGHCHSSAKSLRLGVHRMAKAPSLLTKGALGSER
ncbi:hypothetical protein DPMN_098071 [Dreissena polymorpha]|jgi:hypothetical protein|uniref:Uncharacterized protein n=1 Tax=Dreissena polymorpha TaxID=45954 RepID=A0A9D4LBM3_DREPO|nr:hypothetical protein DPMN_098071 [Dreissena polymorpha]